MLLFSVAPPNYTKILFMLKHLRKNLSLAEHYIKTHEAISFPRASKYGNSTWTRSKPNRFSPRRICRMRHNNSGSITLVSLSASSTCSKSSATAASATAASVWRVFDEYGADTVLPDL
jgi:hypothetical protein